MQQKKIDNIFLEVSTEIGNLLRKGFFKKPGYISDNLVEKLSSLTESTDDYQRTFALLHLGKYICENRVKNRSHDEGIKYFAILLDERLLSVDESAVLSAALEHAALRCKNHEDAVEILKKGYFELGCINALAALSDCLLTGRFPPIQKNEVEWVLLLYNGMLKSLSDKNSSFSFYLHHILECVSEYKAIKSVIKLLSSLIMSEKWTETHLWLLQNKMIKNAQTDATDMLQINEALQIIDPKKLETGKAVAKI